MAQSSEYTGAQLTFAHHQSGVLGSMDTHVHEGVGPGVGLLVGRGVGRSDGTGDGRDVVGGDVGLPGPGEGAGVVGLGVGAGVGSRVASVAMTATRGRGDGAVVGGVGAADVAPVGAGLDVERRIRAGASLCRPRSPRPA